eukprot:2475163-Rhodomonas_salina.4
MTNTTTEVSTIAVFRYPCSANPHVRSKDGVMGPPESEPESRSRLGTARWCSLAMSWRGPASTLRTAGLSGSADTSFLLRMPPAGT